MRATISSAAFLMLVLGCGGRTLLDDPNNELGILVDAGRVEQADGGKKDGSSDASSSGGSPGTMSCGTQTCDTTTEDCCRSLTGMTSASCVAKGKCTGVVTQCAGSSDCAEGDVCCGTFGGTGGTPAGGALAGGALAGGTLAGGALAGGTLAGGTFAGGTFAGGTFAGGTAGGGGFSITVQCAKSCNGFQLCTSNADCSQGVTCQATMFGMKLCGGLGGLGGTFGGGTLAGGTAAGGTAAGGTFAGGTLAGGTAGFGGFGGADGGFGGFAGGFGGFGGFAGGGGVAGH